MQNKKAGLIVTILSLGLLGCATTGIKKTETIFKEAKEMSSQEIEIKKAQPKFVVGEKLIYKVEWLGLTVARAVLEIEDLVKINGREAYKIKLTAETNGLVAAIFPVRNVYLSYVDSENISTLKSETQRREGWRLRKDETVFDYLNHKAYYKDFLKNRQTVVELPDNTRDVLAAAYYFRTIDIKTGDNINYNILLNGKIYPLYVPIKKKEFLIVSNFRTFETFLTEPYVTREGKIDQRARVTAYFSADQNRWPVYIILRGPVFTQLKIFLQAMED